MNWSCFFSMGKNIKIGYGNVIDNAVLTGYGATSGNLPVENIKTIRRGQVFRMNPAVSTATTSSIKITLLEPAQISCVACWFPTDDNVLFRAYVRYNSETLAYSTNSKNGFFFTPVLADEVRIYFESSTHIDLSRVFVGNYFEPILNPEYGLSMKYTDMSEITRTEDGSFSVHKKASYRSLSFNLVEIYESDRAKLTQIIQQSGTQNDIFVSVFSNENSDLKNDFELFGLFEDGAEMAITSMNRWKQKIVVNSL